MDKYAIDGFKDWLIDNTNLAAGSINSYDRVIRRYFREHSNISKDSINHFISTRFREKRSYYVKYAFKYFLEYLGKEDLYRGLVSVKTKPKKSHGTYLPANIIMNIIDSMDHEIYRDIASIQFSVGARAHEIISIREEHIEPITQEGKEMIRIWIHGKGKKERAVFLSMNKKPILQKYMRGRPGFLFLDVINSEDEFELDRLINNLRTYYYKDLMKSANEHGVEKLGTHDHRRNVAEMMRQEGLPLEVIKEVLGHSNIQTTEIYLKKNQKTVQDAMIRHQEREI